MSTSAKIRVLLADDHRLIRDTLKLLLREECEIVGEACDGESAIQLALDHKPRLVILDIEMPGIGGMAAAREIARRVPSARVLILSQYDDEETVLNAFSDAGVAGYALKEDSAQDLLAAVRAVGAGDRYVSTRVAPIVLGRLTRRAHGDGAAEPRLTLREREVIRMIAQGASTKEIAARLKISPKTAQAHRDNLKQKLDLGSTAAMVRYAIKHKLVHLD